VIYPVACAVPGRGPDRPKLSGVVPEIRLRPGSYLAGYYGKEVVEEEFFCNYEMNPDFEWTAMEAGFPVVARGAAEECRAIESPAHRFFIATLFQPQLSSREGDPHPLILAFVQAAADWGRKKLDDSILA
jgi:CTP synthase (UTP-ammonia lyase)